MSTVTRAPADWNAYRYAPELRPGCTHQAFCRCQPPFWSRASTPAEEAIAARLHGPVAIEDPK